MAEEELAPQHCPGCGNTYAQGHAAGCDYQD
jgi:hypothetical protein